MDSVGYALDHLGRHGEAVDYLRTATGMIEGLHAPWQVDMLIHLGDACVDVGRPDDGHRAWRDALTIMDDLHHPDAGPFRAKLAHFQGTSPVYDL